MKKLSILFCLLVFIVGMGKRPPDQTIREIVAQEYPCGNVLIGGNLDSVDCQDIINREFGHISSGFRQTVIHPEPNVWKHNYADAVLRNAAENNQTICMHSHVGPQCSRWAKADNRTAQELETNLREFVRAVASRYSGKAKYMGVVNEAVHKGAWHKPKLGDNTWENPWYAIGLETNGIPKYIKMAFEVANQYASPNCKLGWNHHEKLDNMVSWRKIRNTILWLKSDGLRVDYIGWQAHVDVGWETEQNLDKLRQIIRSAQSMGMDFIVTECEVFITNPTKRQLKAQADTYAAILRTVLEFRNTGTIGVSYWSVSDKCSWKPHWYPGLFDENFKPKPAYNAIRDGLRGK